MTSCILPLWIPFMICEELRIVLKISSRVSGMSKRLRSLASRNERSNIMCVSAVTDNAPMETGVKMFERETIWWEMN
jgi:hypothetical protein